MSNKRIQKKREKARKYQDRIEFVAHLVVALCPCGTKYEQRSLGIALWKRDDAYLQQALKHIFLRAVPFKRLPTPRQEGMPTFHFRPTITDVRER